MSEVKARHIETVDHLKCGEPVWRGARYYCPKHPRIPVPKIRLARDPDAKREPPPKAPEPGMPSAVFLDALMQRLRKSLLTEVEDLAVVGDGINKRLDAIEEKLGIERPKGKAAKKG